MAKEVTWEEITGLVGKAEQGFRARVVAIFRKYDGIKPSDGPRVTKQSFADRHGIARSTFRDWVKTTDTVATDTVVSEGRVTPGVVSFMQSVYQPRVELAQALEMLKTVTITDEDVFVLKQFENDLEAMARTVRAVRTSKGAGNVETG